MDGELKRKVDRLVSMGFNVARPRASIGKLDVLSEITVAICDLFPPALSNHQFWLSDIQLFFEQKEVAAAASLAPFDIDNGVRATLTQIAGSSEMALKHGLKLRIPETVPSEARQEIGGFWNELVPTITLDMRSVEAFHSHTRPEFAIERHKHDYLLNLRQIFDTVAAGDDDVYTLEVRRSGKQFMASPQCPVDFTLGYRLPSSKVYALMTRSEESFSIKEIDELELVLEPGPREVFVSQSHSNVYTRKAGLVRNQIRRTEFLKLKRTSTEGARFVENHETRVWGDEPASILMMPLVSYGCCESNLGSLTTAHCYVAVKDDFEIEELTRRRYRALRSYEDAMYQHYSNELATALALGIHNSEDPTSLSKTCADIAARYFLPSKLLVQDAKDCNLMNLGDSLFLFRKALHREEIRDGRSPWESSIDLSLKSLCLDWKSPSRPTEKTDILGLLIKSLELESGRRDIALRPFRAKFRSEFKDLTVHLDSLAKIKESLINTLEYESAPWDKVKPMRALHKHPPEYPCQGGSLHIEPIDDWRFRRGHNFHEPEDCDKQFSCGFEASRRVAYLFGARMPSQTAENIELSGYLWSSEEQEDRAREFEKFCTAIKVSPGQWIKRSCEEGSERQHPSVAALVTLLFLLGARVEADSLLKSTMPHKLYGADPYLWPVGLAGIAQLSMSGKARPPIKITVETSRIMFDCGKGLEEEMDYRNWFEECRQWAHSNPNPIRHSHSRVRDIAAAYMQLEGSLVKWKAQGNIGRVAVALTETGLKCTWNNLTIRSG